MNQTFDDTMLEAEHPLILASRVEKTPVFDRAGNRIGHIDDLSIEKSSGRAIYAIMSFGGFLGIGEKFHPVPWSLLGYDAGYGGYVVPLDRSALENAPRYDTTELRELGGAREAIFTYYGPYGAAPY
jgi:hypothetical protein